MICTSQATAANAEFVFALPVLQRFLTADIGMKFTMNIGMKPTNPQGIVKIAMSRQDRNLKADGNMNTETMTVTIMTILTGVMKMTTRLVEDSISMVELKNLARKLLPSNSMLRMLILSEPDELPRDEGLAKLQIFVRLLYQELVSR